MFLILNQYQIFLQRLIFQSQCGYLSLVTVFNQVDLSSQSIQLPFFGIEFFWVRDRCEIFGWSEDLVVISQSLVLNQGPSFPESAPVWWAWQWVLAFVLVHLGCFFFLAPFLGHWLLQYGVKISWGGRPMLYVSDGWVCWSVSGGAWGHCYGFVFIDKINFNTKFIFNRI